jgi:hypothetical protein
MADNNEGKAQDPAAAAAASEAKAKAKFGGMQKKGVGRGLLSKGKGGPAPGQRFDSADYYSQKGKK